MLRDLWQDVRFAGRLHRRSPGFALVVVVSLGLGIGVNTALFSLANQLLLRPLSVPAPERLVKLDREGPGGAGPVLSYPAYRAMRDELMGTVPLLATARVWHWNLGLDAAGPRERVAGELTSGNYFQVLGVRPALGRVLEPGDEQEGPVAVLSDRYWRRRFDGDPQVLGRRLVINGSAFTVVGVAQRGFTGLEVTDPVDVWTPLGAQPLVLPGTDWLSQAGNNWLRVMGRLGPGLTTAQAEQAGHAAFRRFLASRGFRNEERILASGGAWGLSSLREQLRRPLTFLAVLVVLVLSIACVNVATLQLGRAIHRQRELAVRVALGGGRGRLVRQLLTETLLLAGAGTALGLWLAWCAQGALLALLFPQAEHPPIELGVDARLLIVCAGLGLLSGLASGLWPALRLGRLTATGGLASGGRVTAAPTRLAGVGLPVAQIALTFVAVVGAGLFARSLNALRALDPGFDREHVLAVRLDAQAAAYTPAQFAALYRRLLDEAAALPGVRAVGLADQAMLVSAVRQRNIFVDGFAAPAGSDLNPYVLGVSPGFLPAVGTPLLAGRAFDENDLVNGAAPVALVNRAFARYYFGDGPAVGRRFGFGRAGAAGNVVIVGVVEDAKHLDLREAPRHIVYSPLGPTGFPTRAFSFSETTLAVRTTGDPRPLAALLRERLAASDPALPVIAAATMEEQVERSLGQDRLVAALSLLFGGLALLLTCLGVHGVLAYSVTRRTREIGVRVALGARPGQVLALVARRSLTILGLGLLVGIPAALATARLARGFLFQVSPADPAVLAGALLVLASITVAASCGPVRRALRVDPMTALRTE
jgi:predicted permease